MSYSEKELTKQLSKNSDIKTAEYAQNAIKTLFGGLIQQMLEAEMEEYLEYSKYYCANKNTTNSRNGKSKKTVKSDLGLFDLVKYPPEILRIIYTTNTMEGYNRQLRKVVKTKIAFLHMKLYLKYFILQQ